MTALWLHTPGSYFPAYFIFLSALLVTIRSDFETMLISRFVTVFLLPLGTFFSFCHLLPISPLDIMIGALVGYFSLYSLSYAFLRITGMEGIGEGDFELLAFIGAFLGVVGCWITLVMSSSLGSILSLGYLLAMPQSKRLHLKIPFGPFLATSAIIYVFFQTPLIFWLLGF